MNWLAARNARRTWQALRTDWVAIPRPVRSRFAWTLTAGWVCGMAAVLATALWLRGERGARLDARETRLLTTLVEGIPLDFSMAVFLESPGNGVVLLPLTLVVAGALMLRHRPLEAVAVLAATLLAAVMVGVGWLTWHRTRPDFLYPDLPAGSLHAFPSGHAGMSIPFYGVLTYLWLRRSGSVAERITGVTLLVVLICTISAARLVLSSHWPSDIVAGTLVGLFWLGIVIHALRRSAASLEGSPR